MGVKYIKTWRIIDSMETVTIQKKEYAKLKKQAQESEVDWEMVAKFQRAFEDIKHGRITEWKSKDHKA